MDSLIVFLLVTVSSGYTFADEGLIAEACNLDDLDCWSKFTHHFLEKTSKGMPKHNITPIDPFTKESLDYVVHEDIGLVFHFKNIIIRGLKNQNMFKFEMDRKQLTTLIKTKVDDLNIAADLIIEFTKEGKWYPGIFLAKANTIGTAQYPLTIRKGNKGVDFVDVGPETIACEAVGEIIVTLDSGFWIGPFDKNPDIKAKCKTNEIDYKELAWALVTAAYVDVIHNIRACTKILPESAFFKNL